MPDLDMLAYDIANMLDKYDYEIDAGQDDIRPHLPAFIEAIRAEARRNEESNGDAATWTDSVESADPTPQSSRRPRMTYLPWRRSQLVMLGATAVDEHYWQCPYTGCKVWAGPYADLGAAKQTGFEHVYTVHADHYFHRSTR